MAYDYTHPFVDASKLPVFLATDTETAQLYGAKIRATEMSNTEYSIRHQKLSTNRTMRPPPSHHRIFAGYLVIRKIDTRTEYETWMPSHVFEDLYLREEPVSASVDETKEKMSLDTHQSVYRERMLEHLLIGDLLKHSWLHSNANLEVSQPSIDRSGHDVVLEANGVTRHIQLKASSLTATTSVQKVHIGLQKKPSGCVVWMKFDPENLALGPFLFFGGLPGEPLPSLDDFKVAKHTKGNAEGVKKDRPNLRLIPASKFRQVASVDELYTVLFGTSPEAVTA
jgi:hypothetical protein